MHNDTMHIPNSYENEGVASIIVSLGMHCIMKYVVTRTINAGYITKVFKNITMSRRLKAHNSVFAALHEMQTRSSDENNVCLSVCPSNA